MNIQARLTQCQQRIDAYLAEMILPQGIEPRLQEAMRYSLFNGGKRIRPALIYLVNQMLAGLDEQADVAAAAIECIHSYSLVHDDLPAMDDDDLRRGKPSCHIAFDEATAILAGDALQCLAFELLSNTELLSPEIQLKLIRTLSEAAGYRGMVAGQAFDLSHVGQAISLDELEAMHQHKTGALLKAAVLMGAQCSGKASSAQLQALNQYATAIGLAFQVQDDILDIEGSAEQIGKPAGSDEARHKPTYPALLGLNDAKALLASLHQQALEALADLPNSEALAELANFIVARDH
ncbi:farnesyl diphosphate synthase [Neptuniibacter sp. CAU 1671]|uniref:polyprenyl synthetase family protein n=1 Tax=Neptuniibacter sp. CAU 1671 TaxID=3032593 RepID=UPI0023DA069C|nr:farnesyl diphosphate synthase [Neptuniibacter sp. CAU 1671]MDF2181684.1 polyprenyl synthetase family protein [Neptuniibacter sp. CAU 1671]